MPIYFLYVWILSSQQVRPTNDFQHLISHVHNRSIKSQKEKIAVEIFVRCAYRFSKFNLNLFYLILSLIYVYIYFVAFLLSEWASFNLIQFTDL